MLHFCEMRLLKEMSWVLGQLVALQEAAASCACSLADTTPWQFRTETPSSWEWQKISRIEKISHCCRQMCHELKLFCSSYYSCK